MTCREWWASLSPGEGFRDELHLAELAWAAATAAERERAAKVADEESEVHRRCSNIYESTACKKVAKHIRDGAELPEGAK